MKYKKLTNKVIYKKVIYIRKYYIIKKIFIDFIFNHTGGEFFDRLFQTNSKGE